MALVGPLPPDLGAYMCGTHKLRADGCATCERTHAALRVLVAEGARRGQQNASDWWPDFIAREVVG